MSSGSRRRAAIAASLLLMSGLVGACTSDDSGDDPPAEATPTVTTEPEPEPEHAALDARIGVVSGVLPPPRRKEVARTVGRVVDRWFRAAWLERDYPRKGFGDAYPRFTKGAGRSAWRDRRLMTNARLSRRIDDVRATRRTVRVDVLGHRKRPVGATARFQLRFVTSGRVERRVEVTGRLSLVRDRRGRWRVFAYDVARDDRPLKRRGSDEKGKS